MIWANEFILARVKSLGFESINIADTYYSLIVKLLFFVVV
jgi:hypothetical protein